MHIFLYEWITGGGLVEERGALSGSLLTEGLAMVQALAADCAAIPSAKVTLLGDFRAAQLVARGCEILTVTSRSERNDFFAQCAASADATILIAPELDGELCRCVDRARDAGARLASPDFPFIGFASSKDWSATHLQAAGVPTPPGRVLIDENEPLPKDFIYPAVVKPVDGAGSQDIYVVANHRDNPPAYAGVRRIETYIPGMAASIAFLCGGTQPIPLLPCSQRLSTDGRLKYLGGSTSLPQGLAERAVGLGQRALAALPATKGYVGIDLVLGSAPDGSEDVVIEVNPRLTTSYVGLRAAATTNLAAAMLAAVQGESPTVEFGARPLEFDAAGNVSFAR